MDFSEVPIGFGFALSQNTAAMNRYAHLTEGQRHDILTRAHSAASDQDMYALVAELANGTLPGL